MKARISVTREHIQEGERENCDYCPVALAIKDRIKPDIPVAVDGLEADFVFEGITIELPYEAQTFVMQFDEYGPKDLDVQPFTFEIDIPKRLLKV